MSDEREAQRRVSQACDLIRSAYRLHSLDPRETLMSVRSAIAAGADEQAADTREAADRA